MQHEQHTLIITGPTASGKTALAERMALSLNGNIINADVGQCYQPLSVGTAKPDWRTCSAPCDLFDIVSEPTDISAMQYRVLVGNVLEKCSANKHVPLIVGGSLFYISSLLFPPSSVAGSHGVSPTLFDDVCDTQLLWNMLEKVDRERAHALHPNDRYRIVRALTIWQSTGIKPSQLRPSYDPVTPRMVIIALEPDLQSLYHTINQRTHDMIMYNGWINEAEGLINTSWRSFIEKKGLIGYKELFSWIEAGKPPEALDGLIAAIAQKTRNYARRQLIFLQKLKKESAQGSQNNLPIKVYSVSELSEEKIQQLIQTVSEDLFGDR